MPSFDEAIPENFVRNGYAPERKIQEGRRQKCGRYARTDRFAE
jgi:hypothetical protein